MSQNNDDLQEYIDMILDNQNIFFNAGGGCGKSYLLKKLYEYIKHTYPHIKCILTASTGISAVNIGGVTFHHFLGLKLAKSNNTVLIKMLLKNKKLLKKWRSIDYIFLDEISMISGSFLDKIDQIARVIRNNKDLPFGGIKFVLSGDHLQLSPINDTWFFESNVWNEMDINIIRMFTPYRYPDKKWFKMLMRIRTNSMTNNDIKKLKNRIINDDDDINEKNSTILYSMNKNVNLENSLQLNNLKTESFIYNCYDIFIDTINKQNIHVQLNYDEGGGYNNENSSSVYSSYTKIMDDAIARQIELKIGCLCIITYNLDVENGIANGTRCIISRFCNNDTTINSSEMSSSILSLETQNCLLLSNGVCVHLFDISTNKIDYSKEHYIPYTKFEIEDDDIIYQRFQIPLKIAYAITIHKSQGLTLNSVCTNISSDIFCAGQAYVALSRCKRLDNLFLLDFDPKKIIVDKKALNFELELLKYS